MWRRQQYEAAHLGGWLRASKHNANRPFCVPLARQAVERQRGAALEEDWFAFEAIEGLNVVKGSETVHVVQHSTTHDVAYARIWDVQPLWKVGHGV